MTGFKVVAPSLDTKISKIDLCHIYMSYASYDIKCHIMTNDAYDIEIFFKCAFFQVYFKYLSSMLYIYF